MTSFVSEKLLAAEKMYKLGATYADIAKLAGVEPKTVSAWLSRLKEWREKCGSKIEEDKTPNFKEDYEIIFNAGNGDEYKQLRRIFNAIRRWHDRNITYEKMAKMTYHEFLQIRGIGYKSIEILKRFFTKRGIKSVLLEK